MAKRISVKKIGDFNNVIKKMEALPTAVQAGADIALRQTTLKGEQIAVKHIKNQDLGWVALNKQYLLLKFKRGLSEKIYVATSSYMQAVTSYAEKGMGWCGVKRGVYSRDSDGKNIEEIANIALTLEYGSKKRNVKERPLWRPTLRELRAWIISSGVFVKAIKGAIK